MPTVNVGQVVRIIDGPRKGCEARVLENLNAFAIKAVIVGGEHNGEILSNVRYNYYRPK